VRRQRGLRTRSETATEVGTHQIALPVSDRTADRKHRKSQRDDISDQSRLVERLADRVARAGAGGLEGEERTGRKGCTGPLQADARCGQAPQMDPWIVFQRWSRRVSVRNGSRAVVSHGSN